MTDWSVSSPVEQDCQHFIDKSLSGVCFNCLLARAKLLSGSYKQMKRKLQIELPIIISGLLLLKDEVQKLKGEAS